MHRLRDRRAENTPQPLTPIDLTLAEAKHILSLISVNTRDGWYHSPREQYWKRSERIKEKIKTSLNFPSLGNLTEGASANQPSKDSKK